MQVINVRKRAFKKYLQNNPNTKYIITKDEIKGPLNNHYTESNLSYLFKKKIAFIDRREHNLRLNYKVNANTTIVYSINYEIFPSDAHKLIAYSNYNAISEQDLENLVAQRLLNLTVSNLYNLEESKNSIYYQCLCFLQDLGVTQTKFSLDILDKDKQIQNKKRIFHMELN